MSNPSQIDSHLFRTILDKLPAAVSVVDTDFRLAWCNEAFVRQFERHYDRLPRVNELLLELPDLDGLSVESMHYNWQRALAGEPCNEIVRLQSASKAHAYYEVRYEPLRNDYDEITGVLQTADELTTQLEIVEMLQKNILRYQTVLKSLPIQLYTQDANLRYVWAHTPSLGVDSSFFVGKTDDELLSIPEEAHYMRSIKLHVMQTGKPHTEIITLYSGEKPVTVEFYVFPLYGYRDEIEGVTVAALDIGERTAVLDRLHEAETLQESTNKERENLLAREQFLKMVSHDIRTPLTVIASSQQILKDYGSELPHDKQLRHIEKIGKHTEYMNNLLAQLSTLDQVRDKINTPRYRVVDLGHFCQELLDDMAIATETLCELVFDGNDAQRWVQIDYDTFYRVLSNLLNNAIKYSPQGGTVHLSLRQAGSTVTFVVRDEGIGIAEEELPHVFKPFHRSKAARKQDIDGSGLGLAIVKLSVEACGGSIDLQSSKGQGTTVTVQLPVTPTQSHSVDAW